MDRLISDLFGKDTGEAARNTCRRVECPYDKKVVMGWVQDTLSGTNNNSAAGANGVVYKLTKVIGDTKLGTEVLWGIVAALRGGYMPDKWRDMRVVLIRKPGRDLKQTKNWRPLNPINCIGKLGENVVADKIQGERESVLHHQQFCSVHGRSAVDILNKWVIEAGECLEDMGSVG